jgi:hypothetical protein
VNTALDFRAAMAVVTAVVTTSECVH